MALWQRIKNSVSAESRTRVAPVPARDASNPAPELRLLLVFQRCSRQNEKLLLQGTNWRLGTALGSEILFDMLQDAEVDAQHAEIKWAGGKYWIVPKAPSRTWLNGVLLQAPKALAPDDQLSFGLKHGPGVNVVLESAAPAASVSGGRGLRVRIERGAALKNPERFEKSFVLGRSSQCELQFNDSLVSGRHAEVALENGRWFVQDLQSTNGTFVNGARINRLALPAQAKLELALGGPVIALTLEAPAPAAVNPAKTPPDDLSMSHIEAHYFGEGSAGQAGAHTILIRRAFQQVRRKQSKRYWWVIGAIAVLLLGAMGALYMQNRRVNELERLHAIAEDLFYAMKTQEVQIAQLRALVAASSDVQLKKQVEEKMRQQQSRSDEYGKFTREALGISREKLPAEDWQIYQMARLFGECDASLPPDFMQIAKKYIGYWKSTALYQESLTRAQTNGYTAPIIAALKANDLPPHFFYLALQESNFDVKACGPSTKYGYAKGMWQFIPQTAKDYGLHIGPWVDFQIYDPRDERHDFEKSTAAAAKYLHDLYATKAQASGLLVIACYNWGESNILPLIERLPENPRERNFWKLLMQAKIPQETYDYVFYIFSAAVIGENPRLYGFDFDNPLSTTL